MFISQVLWNKFKYFLFHNHSLMITIFDQNAIPV